MINYENLFDKGMLINLKMGSWAARNKLPEEDLKDLPKEIVRGVFDLIDDKELLDNIVSHQNKLRNIVKGMTVPFPIDGVYFVLGKDIEQVTNIIKEKTIEIEELSKEFAVNYEKIVKDYSQKYPRFYQIAKHKYPSAKTVQDRFYVTFKMFQINVPSKKLSFISPELYKEEMRKFKDDVGEMKREVINIICSELMDRVSSLAVQCKDGKPSQRTLNNLNELFGRVENLYSDFIDRDDIRNIIAKIQKSVVGIDAKDLRDSDKFKSDFGKKMKEVAAELKELPEVELRRSIIL